MYSLPVPQIDPSGLFRTCAAAVEDSDLRARLNAIEQPLFTTAVEYDTHARAKTLHLIPRVTSVGSVTKDELVSLYADHVSATRGAARRVYDQIKNAAPNKRCPLCGIGTVAHLDHHLPKRKYPDLAIVPSNLVPACHFCNDTKKARFPQNAEQQTFHPYYDSHLLSAQWITATLDHGPPPVLVFSANPPASWPLVDQRRVERHFSVCGLATTFTSNANDQLSPMKQRLVILGDRGGAVAVAAYLNEEKDSYSNRPNSWQYVMYQTLAADAWFIDGGYRLVP
jgi:5-methylcytosine-specific restriction endonuclease McrA